MAAAIITDDHRETFVRDGVVKIEQAVSGDHLDNMLRLADEQLESPGRYGSKPRANAVGHNFTDRYLWRDNDTVRDLVFESGVARLAGELMDVERVRFYFDHLLVKEPGTPDATPWHQDIPYWPFLGRTVCSVWVSATDLSVDQSSLEFVRGSHDWGKYFAPKAFTPGTNFMEDGNDDLEELPDIEAERDNFDISGFDVKAGDALVFSSWIVHGAPGNAGDTRRVAFSTRWLGDDATWAPTPSTDPTVTQADVTVQPGEYPADDDRFPVGWSRG